MSFRERKEGHGTEPHRQRVFGNLGDEMVAGLPEKKRASHKNLLGHESNSTVVVARHLSCSVTTGGAGHSGELPKHIYPCGKSQ